MASQEVFFLIDADRISPSVERAVQTNNPRKIAEMSQNLERGDRILRSWLEDRGGRVLLFHGDELYCSLPGEKVGDLGTLQEQLQEAWNDSITIGVGLTLREAKRALESGKKRGGHRIVFYAPEIEQMLPQEESASDSHVAHEETPDPDKLKHLSKSNTPSPMSVHGAMYASLANDQSGPPSPPPQLSPYGAPQESASGQTPITPSSTNMAEGLPSAMGESEGGGEPSAIAGQFHDAAQGSEAEAARAEAQANAAQPNDPGMDQIKQVIVKILQKVKQQAPVLESLKEQAPDAYQAIVAAIQAMLLMAKSIVPAQAQQAQEGEGQEQGQEKPKEDVKKSEALLKRVELIGELLEKASKEDRALHHAVLNDSLTTEQLQPYYDRILQNITKVPEPILEAFVEHPNVTPQMVTALASQAYKTWMDSGRKIRPAKKIYDELVRNKKADHKALMDTLEPYVKEKEATEPKSYGKTDYYLTNSKPSLHNFYGDLLNDDDVKDRMPSELINRIFNNVKSPNFRRSLLQHPNATPEMVGQVSHLPTYYGVLQKHPLLSKEQHGKLWANTNRALDKFFKLHPNPDDYLSYEDRQNRNTLLQRAGDLIHHHQMPLEEAKQAWQKYIPRAQGAGLSPIFARDPDVRHTDFGSQLVDVKPGSNKYRVIRDAIEGRGGELSPNDLGRPLANFLGPVGRMSNGNYSSKGIQEHIDKLPGVKLWLSHGAWNGGQQHSAEPSKVLKVSLPTELSEKLLAHGLNTKAGHRAGHPGDPASGLGWVRWTGDKNKGVQIDEIQHDFPSKHEKALEGILGAPINRVLHEAMHEYVRQGGKQPTTGTVPAGSDKNWQNPPVIGTPVHVFTPETKAPLSQLDEDQPIPGHFRQNYRQIPEKMGYQPGTYGTIGTQKNKELKGKPTYQEVFRKSLKDIRASALSKSYTTAIPLEPKSTGIDNQIKVHPDTYPSDEPGVVVSHKAEVEPTKPVPTGSRLDKIRKSVMQKALLMPEATNKMPPTPSGSLAIRVQGDAAPQAHKFRHIEPGEAAHVSMDGKPQGKIAIRQYQSGMAMPNENMGEGQVGIIHPTSALDPKDGRAKQGQGQ